MLFVFVLLIASAGWASTTLFVSKDDNKTECVWGQALFRILSGFGAISVLLFLLALLGLFHLPVLLVCLAILFLVAVLRRRGSIHGLATYAVLCIGIFSGAWLLSRMLPPYESYLLGDDSSTYLAAAHSLMKTGTLFPTDSLLLQMTEQERAVLFKNRSFDDTTGTYARFLGGVRLLDPKSGTITFAFYHMFPVWLAFGIQVLGRNFLDTLSLFFIVSLVCVYEIERNATASKLCGAGLAAALFSFYPQIFFARMPASEILTEFFFLAGLYAFLISSEPKRDRQLLAGVLWGAMFLTRLDAMIFTLLSLLLIFAFVPVYARNAKQWNPLFGCLVVFSCVAVYHQLSTKEYLYFEAPALLGARSLAAIYMAGLRSVSDFIAAHRYASPVLLISVCAVVLFLTRILLKPQTLLLRKAIAIGCLLLSFLPLFVRQKPASILRHLSWIAMYLTPWVFALLLAGCICYLIAKRKDPRLQAIFLFFVIPFVCYVVFPLVVFVYQPWAIRRFVPLIFPLLFVLGTGGLYQVLSRIPRTRNVAFACVVVIVCFLLWSRSAMLVVQPLFQGVYNQTKMLAARIPDEAIVAVPDNEEHFHAGMTLQYVFQKNVMSIPMEQPQSPEFNSILYGFFDRQKEKKRPLLLLLQKDFALYRNAAYLDLQRQDSFKLSFITDPHYQGDRFPYGSLKNDLSYDLFSVSKRELPPKNQIAYDDPDVTFLNFQKLGQRRFRWTSGSSEIAGFTYEPHGKEVLITIETDSSVRLPKPPKLEVFLNYDFATEMLSCDPGTCSFRGSLPAGVKVTSVLLKSNYFVPAALHLNTDERRLGLPFVRLRLSPAS